MAQQMGQMSVELFGVLLLKRTSAATLVAHLSHRELQIRSELFCQIHCLCSSNVSIWWSKMVQEVPSSLEWKIQSSQVLAGAEPGPRYSGSQKTFSCAL